MTEATLQRGPGARLAAGGRLSERAVAVVLAITRMALAREVGLDGSDAAPDWESVPPEDFLEAARVHRVTPLLAPIIRDSGAPEAFVTGVLARERNSLLRAMRMVAESGRAAQTLKDAGIPFLMIKGVALSVQTTGSPTGRGPGDVDLVVRPSDLPRVHEALVAAGWEGDPLRDDSRWWGWYLQMRRERSYLCDASHVDLHWRIGWHDQPLPDVDVLLRRCVRVDVGNVSVPTLAVPDAFTAACYHATVDRFARLRSLIDIARLARRDDVYMPPDASWRLRRLVGEAVAFTDELLGSPGPESVSRYVPRDGVDTSRMWRIWDHSSVSPAWGAADIGLGAMVEVYRDSARFAGMPSALAMALSDGLLPPERLASASGPEDVARAVGVEVADLVRRRILRRSPAPDSTPSGT